MKKNFWDSKSVLVTGAGGFKGSHVVEELSKSKANIISLIKESDPKSYFNLNKLGDRSIVFWGDLKDRGKIEDIVSRFSIDIIFHLGAQPLVQAARKNPRETLESNIMGTINVLEAARLYKVDRTLIVSSDKAYGLSENLPYKEDFKLQGKDVYDVSKSCVDMISQTYSIVYGLPLTIARCANVFGPGDLNMDRIVPGTMESIIKNKPLEIRSDGKMIREYIYVKDAADAYISLLENFDKTRGEVFNVASKNVLSVLEIVNKISSVLDKKIETRILNNAKYEIPKQCLDGSKIKECIGFECKTKFEEAIKETYNWYERVLN